MHGGLHPGGVSASMGVCIHGGLDFRGAASSGCLHRGGGGRFPPSDTTGYGQ